MSAFDPKLTNRRFKQLITNDNRKRAKHVQIKTGLLNNVLSAQQWIDVVKCECKFVSNYGFKANTSSIVSNGKEASSFTFFTFSASLALKGQVHLLSFG